MIVNSAKSNIVRLHWQDSDGETSEWNEACAWAIETFGLPGDRFTTEVTADWMEFKFHDSRDQVLMLLRWS